MSGLSNRLADALDAVGAKLTRQKKHLVFKLPNGRTFVTGKTPSDHRAEQNAISDLRAVAGVESQDRRKAPADVRAERRSRPGRAGEAPRSWGSTSESQMAAALRETALRAEIVKLNLIIDAQEVEIGRLESLWVVRAWNWWRHVIEVAI